MCCVLISSSTVCGRGNALHAAVAAGTKTGDTPSYSTLEDVDVYGALSRYRFWGLRCAFVACEY